MKTKKNIFENCIARSFPILLLLFFIHGAVFAATTGTNALLRQIGRAAATASGDYVSADLGLDQPLRYYIEVPPGTSNLTVEIYDADIGAVANYTDWDVSGGFNTSCIYTLNRPNATQAATATYNWTQTTADSAWTQLYTVANPAAGHWELVVEMSQTGNGNDMNGYGISAHDGTAGAGGTELNVYAHSFLPLGVVGTSPTTITTTFYPYVTSGCTVDWNDFDGDDTGAGTERLRLYYASRMGLVSGNYRGSNNDVWTNRPIALFPTIPVSRNEDMGIWTGQSRFTTLDGTAPVANFGNFWAGNWLAANGQPSAQPQANSFRVYLPTDSGGAPAKPYLTQRLSHISGPNPPQNANTTYIAVIIDFVNPTAKAVTFSAANLVTVRVPGGRVRYRGSAYTSVSQGAIVAQPGALQNAAANLTWNPGIVAAGATATLYYQVRLIPSAVNQTNNITGTPAATNPPNANDGTWARYVDETGNTTQARATYIFGPLCQLSTYAGTGGDIPTWVGVSCFDACAEESQPTVEWHTASEIGPAGFNLWRQDRETKEYELVNPSLLPALPNSPQGGVYRFADPGALSGEPVTYRLEEIDALGRTMSYGPFTVTFGVSSWSDPNLPEVRIGREEPSEAFGYRRFERARTEMEEERLNARRRERLQAAQPAGHLAGAGPERVRITVKGRGLFYVSAAQVANSLGIAEAAASAMIGNYNLSLTGLGQEIAWLADANGAGLYFYNEGKETVYCNKNVYFLEQGKGRAMEAVSGGNAGPASPGLFFVDALHFEDNRYPIMIAAMDPAGDLWFWDYVIAGNAAKTFAVQVPAPAGAGRAALTVALQGTTDTDSSLDHHAIVALNGQQIGEALWDGTKAHVFEIALDSSLLLEGGNTLSVSGVLDTGAPYSVFYLESFDLSYPRYYKAVDNSLICRGEGNSVVTVSGLTETQTMVLDVSNADRPRQLTGVAPDLSGNVTFVPHASGNTYAVSGLNAALRPLAVVGGSSGDLNGLAGSAEYIVIAPTVLAATAQELADYRSSKGLKSRVVTLEDIYDAYNYGVPDPHAIRTFLAREYGKKLKYAVLAGKGTYDYNDYLGHGDNLVPVILASTPQGLCAADKMFGDVKKKNGLPEIAIGRLPAVTNAELQAMIAKIKAYESDQGEWTARGLFLADNADNGGDFASGSDELAALTAGIQAEKVYLNGSAAEERAQLLASWNAGTGLVNYCGHGGITNLASEKMLTAADAAALQNGGRLPLAVMLTCVVGRFELSGYISLGEALLLNANGGMAGGLMPSGAALHSDSMRLAAEFYKAAYRGQEESAGKALLAAMKAYIQQGGAAYLLNVYNWLGDPALSFK